MNFYHFMEHKGNYGSDVNFNLPQQHLSLSYLIFPHLFSSSDKIFFSSLATTAAATSTEYIKLKKCEASSKNILNISKSWA